MTCNNNIVVPIEHFHLPHDTLTGRKKPHEKNNITFSTLIKI